MQDMQKEIHSELEQSDKGGVSQMPESQEESEASASQEAEKVARESAKSVNSILDYVTATRFDTIMLSLHPTIPGVSPKSYCPHCRNNRPHPPVSLGRNDRKEPALATESMELVRTVPRAKEESREPSDAGQADRSNQGTGKAGNVDPESSEGV